jgi:hypothetical protein
MIRLSFFLICLVLNTLYINVFAQDVKTTADTTKLSAIDTLDHNDTYELLIFDPGFESWFNKVKKPESFYNQPYLESWNLKLVNQWNIMLNRPQRADCTPTTYIHYDQTVDYGLTLNYRLFYYFRYMQHQCKFFDSYPANW